MMSDTAELLFANEAFYHVFRGRDLAAMGDLWARRAPVACVHPGWHALNTREAVMDSWEGILSTPRRPRSSAAAPAPISSASLES